MRVCDVHSTVETRFRGTRQREKTDGIGSLLISSWSQDGRCRDGSEEDDRAEEGNRAQARNTQEGDCAQAYGAQDRGKGRLRSEAHGAKVDGSKEVDRAQEGDRSQEVDRSKADGGRPEETRQKDDRA
jgi:hypothetical protein